MDSSSCSTGDHHEQVGTWMFHHYDSISAVSGGHSSMQCPYYVQSPISSSCADAVVVKEAGSQINGNTNLLSPTRSDIDTATLLTKDVTAFTLSRYSSSRGSSTNPSFLHDPKKLIISGGEEEETTSLYGDDNNNSNNKSNNVGAMNKSSTGGVKQLVIVDQIGFRKEEEGEEDDDDEEEYYYEKMRSSSGRSGWRSFCSFGRSSSCAWIWVQLCWRFFVSLGLALLVFYIATKPPLPMVSVKVVGMNEFVLAEGVDSTGVTTKILTCNCSLNLLIENKSKVFGLHVHPPLLQLSFAHLPVAMSHGSKLYADNNGWTSFQLYVGTRNKPMYGAGRNMQDLIESGRGLPIEVRVRLSSYFQVVSNIIRPKFHHKAECMLLLDNTYDKKHHTQTFHGSCTVVS